MKDKKYSILFIGNSYTYFNDMPKLFLELATSAGYNLEVDSVTKGGWTLEKHADINDECGSVVDKKLKENKYDYVILQEQSIRPAVSPELFFESARALYEKIRQNGATPVFYSTWGRKIGSSALEKYNLTNDTMTKKIAMSYKEIAQELNVPVFYVGLAFYEIYRRRGLDIELYANDLTHPSYNGSFLAAAVLFSGIFKHDVREVSFSGELSADVEEIIKSVSWAASMGELSFDDIPSGE